MKVLLALLALAASPAAAYECDESGFNKTVRACGQNGERVGTRACDKRIGPVLEGCQNRIARRGKKAAAASERIVKIKELYFAHIRAVKERGLQPDPEDAKEAARRAKAAGEGPYNDDGTVDVDAALDDAREALQSGDPRGAVAALKPVLDADPKNATALRLSAQSLMNAGEKEAAVAEARRLVQLMPDDELARSILGQAEALALSERKLQRVPTVDFESKDDGGFGGSGGPEGRPAGSASEDEPVPSAFDFGPPPAAVPASALQVWNQAARRFSLGDWTSAVFHATRYTKLHPDDPRGWLLRARALNKLKDWAAAEADARKALALKPDDPAALLELGYALLGQGRATEALGHIDRALGLDPRNGLGHLYRAEALLALGRTAEAIEAYRAAARHDPALKSVVEAALAKLVPGSGVPAPAAPPPWRLPLRAATAAAAAGFLFMGLRYVLGARRERTTRPPVDLAPAPAAATPLPGDLVGGQFRVERELARGGMGMVYLATDTVLNRPVAIKRLNREAMESADARRKFLQEAQLAARLKHPNLAQILSVFGDGELYLVFELVEGEGLDGVLARRGSLPLAEVRALVRQACAALGHAHQNRVIHRDLKPANMMLGPDGTLKLMDFGIAHEARTVSSVTATQAWGTPPYMAPEQEDGYVLPASDLYALAVTAYELVSGRRPFDGAGLYGQKRAKSFARLGGAYDAFFERALDPDPARRFATAADFAAAFDALSETPVRS